MARDAGTQRARGGERRASPDNLLRLVAAANTTLKNTTTHSFAGKPTRREQRRVVDLMGKLEWNDAFDYKAERSRS